MNITDHPQYAPPAGIIGLGLIGRIKRAEQVEEELIEKVKKLDNREQKRLLKQLRERGE